MYETLFGEVYVYILWVTNNNIVKNTVHNQSATRIPLPVLTVDDMSLLTDTQNCGLRMRRESRERFPRHRRLATPICITAWRTCRDASRCHYLAVSFEVGGREDVPGIPGACATHNFTYLVRGPWVWIWIWMYIKVFVTLNRHKRRKD